jgi:mono/diheme cytochrome c family protein
MIKSLLLITAAVLIASALVPAQTQTPQDAASPSDNAKMLYQRDCAICHGATGDGKTDISKDRQLVMLDWTDPKTLTGFTDQQLFSLIRNGKGKMPAESFGRANNEDVRAIIKYIRALSRDQSTATTPLPKQ